MDYFNIGKLKIHLKHELRRKFETSILVTIGILVALVKRQLGQGYSK